MATVENLKPVRTKEEARERGKAGGIKSGKVRREKTLMSKIYADILADQSGIKRGKGLKSVIDEILSNTDPKTYSSRVALLKELREATEGTKIKSETNINFNDPIVSSVLAKHGITSKD
jgi:hypothetical protein